MMILLDNGHGENTPGKRSPKWADGSMLFEYEFNRDIVNRIAIELTALGIQHGVLVPELKDISLSERCRRVNSYDEAILVSVHANAGGGTGFEIFTSVGDTTADQLATIMFNCAEQELREYDMRKDMSDGDPDKESQFYILKHTKHPAMLTENMFMDNYNDCKFIMSDEGRQRIAKFHVRAIAKMIP